MRKNMVLMVALAVGALYLPVALAEGAMRDQLIFAGVLDPREQLGAEFHVNRDLGRAWVAVELTPDGPGEFPLTGETQNIPRMVDGLTYDKSTKQVIYQRGKMRVVCAEDSTFLWDTSLKTTGQCPLQVSTQTRTVDNGFNPHKEIVGKVVLQLPKASSSISKK